jgi:hypothetical protein
MGGLCDRPDAAACDYRLTYRSSQMVRTGAAQTKQCCEHMISATTTRELSTGLDESAGKTHIAWTSDCNRRCRRLRSVHARHEHTTPRAPSEMVAWWMPGRRFLGTARSPSSHVGTTREQQTGRDPSAQNVTLLMKGPRGVSLS